MHFQILAWPRLLSPRVVFPRSFHRLSASFPEEIHRLLHSTEIAKSSVNPALLHTFYKRFSYAISAVWRQAIFISFFMSFSRAVRTEKGRKASGIQNLRKSGPGGPVTTICRGGGRLCTQNVARGTIFLSNRRWLRRRRSGHRRACLVALGTRCSRFHWRRERGPRHR